MTKPRRPPLNVTTDPGAARTLRAITTLIDHFDQAPSSLPVKKKALYIAMQWLKRPSAMADIALGRFPDDVSETDQEQPLVADLSEAFACAVADAYLSWLSATVEHIHRCGGLDLDDTDDRDLLALMKGVIASLGALNLARLSWASKNNRANAHIYLRDAMRLDLETM